MLEHPVPEKLLARIGDITVSFAILENVIQGLVRSFINEHQRVGQIITLEVPFKTLRALAISLYKDRHGADEDYRTLKALMTRASTLEERRNQITHSVWGGGGPDKVTRIKGTAKEKKGLHFSAEEMTESDFNKIATDLRQLAHEVQQYMIHLIDLRKAVNNPIQKYWP